MDDCPESSGHLRTTRYPWREGAQHYPDSGRRPMAAPWRRGQDGTKTGVREELAVMLFAIVLLLTIGCIAFVLAREAQRVPRPDGLRGRIRDRGWGLLLLPVAMAAAVMAGGAHGLILAELGLAALTIVQALKKYGVIFADQGSKLYISGVTDPGWTSVIGIRPNPLFSSLFR